MSIKILHTADIHLDTPFSSFEKNLSELRKDELHQVVNNIISLAIEKTVDVVFICGDLFDGKHVSPQTISMLKSAFSKAKSIYFFIIAGNHDHLCPASPYVTEDLGENVIVFDENITKISIPEKNAEIYGISFTQSHVDYSLLKNFKPKLDYEKINILLMHGDIISSGTKTLYNPVTVDEIKNSGFDYIALGHIHNKAQILKVANTHYAYSGNPQGREYNETGEKGVWIGNIHKNDIDLSFYKTSKRQYNMLEIDISSLGSINEIKDKIEKKLIDETINPKENIYKLILTGKRSYTIANMTTLLYSTLSHMFFHLKIEDISTLLVDYQALSKEYSLKGLFCKNLLDKIDGSRNADEKEALRLALEYGYSALIAQEVNVIEY